MASRTPRSGRRRRPTQQSFPVIPIAVGVVILGFAIGAGIPTLRRTGQNTVAFASPTPALVATPPAPLQVPSSPEPTLVPTDLPERAARAAPSSIPRMPRSAPPAPHALHAQAASAAPTVEAPQTATPATSVPQITAVTHLRESSGVAASAQPAPSRAPSASPAAKAVAVQASAAPQAGGSDSPLLRDAATTVRTYISALIAGDDRTAASQLLADAGSPASDLTEKHFLDKSAHIVDLTSTVTSPSTASVDVDIATGKGSYYAHYELRRLDSGVTLIREHNYATPP